MVILGWFDEQIKKRKEKDDEVFEEAFEKLASSILGQRISNNLGDERKFVKDALDGIMNYYHIKPKDVPDSFETVDEKMDFLFRPYGIMYRTVKLEKGWYKDAAGVMLATKKDDDSLVTLIPNKFNGYRYFDSKLGKYININSKNENELKIEALCFYKSFPLKKLSIKELCHFLFGCVSFTDVVLFLGATLFAILIAMFIPKINNIIFSNVIVHGNIQTVLAIFIFLLCIMVSNSFILVIKKLLLGHIQIKMDLSVKSAVMMRILSLPADFFKKYSSGELSVSFTYLGTLCELLVSSLLDIGLTSLFSLIYIVQIFTYAPKLVIPALGVIIVTTIYLLISAFVQMKITEKKMKLVMKEKGISYSLITGIQKVRLSGSEKRAFSKWAKIYAEEAELQYNPPLLIKLNSVISLAISLIGVIILQSMAVISGVSVADYYSFNTAYGMVLGAFMSLASVVLTIAQIRPIMDMARPLLETEPEVAEKKQVLTRLSGSIELNNISFRYNENTPLIIDNLSLKIRSGQYIAIVGSTGCGKSTLLRLMLGFEKPQKGAIYYDGKDMESMDLKSLRSKIGVVLQNGKLFQGDIYSNIVISAPQLTVQNAWEVAEKVGMADDIRNMPMGMHTLISEGNGGISGGQRQRILIARALASKPRVLMFDEATSALDNITQKIVSESLEKLKCTRIIIAHRLSTIKQCDRIIVLNEGKIVEDGSYSELIKKDGYFAELVERQRVDN